MNIQFDMGDHQRSVYFAGGNPFFEGIFFHDQCHSLEVLPPLDQSLSSLRFVSVHALSMDFEQRLLFTPVLQIAGISSDKKVLTIEPNSGRLLSHALNMVIRRSPIYLISDRSRSRCYTVDNTETTISLADPAISAVVGDYLLIPPEGYDPTVDLPLIQMERGPTVEEPLDLHNWAASVSSGLFASYLGNPFNPPTGQLTSPDPAWLEVNFKHLISPIARGLVGTLQVLADAPGGAYARLGRDNSNHVYAWVGGTATAVNHSVGAPFQIPFAHKQHLYLQTVNCRAKITITGHLL